MWFNGDSKHLACITSFEEKLQWSIISINNTNVIILALSTRVIITCPSHWNTMMQTWLKRVYLRKRTPNLTIWIIECGEEKLFHRPTQRNFSVLRLKLGQMVLEHRIIDFSNGSLCVNTQVCLDQCIEMSQCTHLPALSIFSNTGLSDNSLFGHAKKPHTMNFQSTKTILPTTQIAKLLHSMKKFLVSGLNCKTYHVGEWGGGIHCWLTNFLLNWDQIDKTVYRQRKGW